MLRDWANALGFNRPNPSAAPVTPVRPEHSAPTATDTIRRHAISDTQRAPTLQARQPADHARALLAWLQGPGGRSGTIFASELLEIHRDLCSELDWELVGWGAVGRELRRLIGTPKEYARFDGRRVCVYRIPPRGDQLAA